MPATAMLFTRPSKGNLPYNPFEPCIEPFDGKSQARRGFNAYR